MATDPRGRALLLLALAFVAGAFAGAAIDRQLPGTRRVERRATTTERDIERIPTPLARLGLTADETARLRVIARRWRPQTQVALGDFRQRVAELENGMFAEMLCALPAEKRDRYVAQLRAARYDSTVIAKRLRLVQTNACPHGGGS